MSRLLLLFFAVVCAVANAESSSSIDPWEKWNRRVFVFNQTLDYYVLKPVAQGYKAVLPDRVEQGVNNFFTNLEIPLTIVNSLAQAKWRHALEQSSRFCLNTFMGFGGLVNVAGYLNLGVEAEAAEDFGQTLRVWGVPPGPFVMLPFFGPSTLDALPSYGVDYWLDPINYHQVENSRHWIIAADTVNTRVQYLPTDALIQGDPYNFIRNTYLQRREFLIHDGKVEDTFLNDDY